MVKSLTTHTTANPSQVDDTMGEGTGAIVLQKPTALTKEEEKWELLKWLQENGREIREITGCGPIDGNSEVKPEDYIDFVEYLKSSMGVIDIAYARHLKEAQWFASMLKKNGGKLTYYFRK